MRGLRLAVGFLTVLPVRVPDPMGAGGLGRAALWFPFVGLGIGAGLWILDAPIRSNLPELAAAALIVALWAMVTGALHLDGFADSCDGLFAPASPDRRLEIMADSRTGAFGVVGVSLLLMLKITAVSGLTNPIALVLAPVLGRSWMLPMAMMTPARGDGLGTRLHSGLSWRRMLAPGLAVVAVVALAGPRAWAALVASGATTLALGWLARSHIGGQTGDVLGANCELAEWVVLLAYLWG